LQAYSENLKLDITITYYNILESGKIFYVENMKDNWFSANNPLFLQNYNSPGQEQPEKPWSGVLCSSPDYQFGLENNVFKFFQVSLYRFGSGRKSFGPHFPARLPDCGKLAL